LKGRKEREGSVVGVGGLEGEGVREGVTKGTF